MDKEYSTIADKILKKIKSSNKILMHCHPYPDPDSVGSVLAMGEFLKKLGKEIVIIGGDSTFPKSLGNFPNRDWIKQIDFSQVNLEDFDLFLILDSSSMSQITQKLEIKLPKDLETIVIDHHVTNTGFGKINLIAPELASTTNIIYQLFKLWGDKPTEDMAVNLFMGIYGDTGGLIYPNAKPNVWKSALELIEINPDYHQLIFDLNNNRRSIEVEMMGLALSNIKTFYSGKVALSVIPYDEIKKRNLSKEDAIEGLVPDRLRSVVGWEVVASLVEVEPNEVIVSLRTRNEAVYDVSKIAKNVGIRGGGHRGAAGTTIKKSAENAVRDLVEYMGKNFTDLKS